jgi:hypothetical protein
VKLHLKLSLFRAGQLWHGQLYLEPILPNERNLWHIYPVNVSKPDSFELYRSDRLLQILVSLQGRVTKRFLPTRVGPELIGSKKQTAQLNQSFPVSRLTNQSMTKIPFSGLDTFRAKVEINALGRSSAVDTLQPTRL